jgi:hypothetical protein
MLLEKTIQFLKKFSNEGNHVKRGIHRIGMLISFILSGAMFLIGIFWIFESSPSEVIFALSFTVILTVVFFALPILLAKGIGWIVEGFQRSNKINESPKESVK